MRRKIQKNEEHFSSPLLKNASNTLFANIRFASVDRRVRVIAVTSAGPDEGKTTVCTNLACAMASSGKSVLLVETDMRKRSLAAKAKVYSGKGIYSVLSGECRVEDAICDTEAPGVQLLDVEPGIPNPPDLLSSRRFDTLVEALSLMYDYVILDTPPLGLFVDAALVGNVADGVLFVVRERYVKRNQIAKGLSQLEQANAHILGIVTTFSQDQSRGGYYYYGYYEEGGQSDFGEGSGLFESQDSTEDFEGDFDAWTKRAGIENLVKTKTPRHSSNKGKFGL